MVEFNQILIKNIQILTSSFKRNPISMLDFESDRNRRSNSDSLEFRIVHDSIRKPKLISLDVMKEPDADGGEGAWAPAPGAN